MLGLKNSASFSSIPSSLHHLPLLPFPTSSLSLFKPRKPRPIPPLFASNNNDNGVKKEKEGKKKLQEESSQEPLFGLNFNWSKRLLEPDPDNVLALGLTGLLTWASVQVLWQLLFISFAILFAALKYSFIAALLIFILIALL
uniref:Uncharacterized protein LOC101500222 n=1 Tax=Cicer arietinum TaxID=3827 RepID=A0A1S2Y2G0_CICAR|nr:uncharacterized protein LOC101500222 [Cicer arietinum]